MCKNTYRNAVAAISDAFWIDRSYATKIASKMIAAGGESELEYIADLGKFDRYEEIIDITKFYK